MACPGRGPSRRSSASDASRAHAGAGPGSSHARSRRRARPEPRRRERVSARGVTIPVAAFGNRLAGAAAPQLEPWLRPHQRKPAPMGGGGAGPRFGPRSRGPGVRPEARTGSGENRPHPPASPDSMKAKNRVKRNLQKIIGRAINALADQFRRRKILAAKPVLACRPRCRAPAASLSLTLFQEGVLSSCLPKYCCPTARPSTSMPSP